MTRGLQHLPAAEGEQLAGQDRRPLGGGRDLPSAPARELGSSRFEQLFRVAADHGEQVVEVVGDAAGEAADRLQLCAWRSCSSSCLALADVAADRLDADRDGRPP